MMSVDGERSPTLIAVHVPSFSFNPPSVFHGKNSPAPDKNEQQGHDGVENGDAILVVERSDSTISPKVIGFANNNVVETDNDLKGVGVFDRKATAILVGRAKIDQRFRLSVYVGCALLSYQHTVIGGSVWFGWGYSEIRS
mmetsp:Transcript_16883/g.36616  ORF Transcript_16883/g.36616 Transcript_16883/m.36616 type:complete len:140 (+) Transcript_16883:1225-1644(+)